MITERRAVLLLKVFLVALFGILVVFQTLSFPGQFAHMARENPHDASLRWPLTALFAFWLCCIEVVIVSTWKLLTRVRNDRIFTEASLVWVDVILWSIGAAWTVLLAVFSYVVLHADDPGLPMVLLLLLVGVAVFGLLMIVMRALLRQATRLRTDMEAVI
jgi:hypothetical protein